MDDDKMIGVHGRRAATWSRITSSGSRLTHGAAVCLTAAAVAAATCAVARRAFVWDTLLLLLLLLRRLRSISRVNGTCAGGADVRAEGARGTLLAAAEGDCSVTCGGWLCAGAVCGLG